MTSGIPAVSWYPNSVGGTVATGGDLPWLEGDMVVDWPNRGAMVNEASEKDSPWRLQAKASLPISESSWHLVQVRFPWSCVMARRSSSLRSEVMDAVIVTESRRMPSAVAGPSVFSGLMGTLMVEHA